MENYYSKLSAKLDMLVKIRFEGSEITLNIPEDGKLTQEGWKIIPMTHPLVCFIRPYFDNTLFPVTAHILVCLARADYESN